MPMADEHAYKYLDVPARLSRCNALLQGGHLGAAIDDLLRVISLDPENTSTRFLLAKALALHRKRNDECARRKEIEGYAVLKCLGVGREGSIYLTRDAGGRKRVVKALHPHRVGQTNHDKLLGISLRPIQEYRGILVRLSNHLKEQSHQTVDTLYPFDLLEHSNTILGFVYEYEYLIRINRRHLVFSDVVLGIMSAFFRTQAYLCATVRLCLADAKLANFMITRTGRLRYVDYGTSFVPIDDAICLEEHEELFGLIRLLYQLFKPADMRLLDGRDVDIVLDKSTGLLAAAEKHDWLSTILSTIDARRYKSFLDPDYYIGLASRLPQQVGAVTQAAVVALDALAGAKRLLSGPVRDESLQV